jgi:hypothetical protein
MGDIEPAPNVDAPKATGRSWKYILTEFFMIFLAVFSGFLAENYREDFADRKDERKYMRLLIEDLKSDTALCKINVSNIDVAVKNIDSLLLFLKHHPNLEYIDTLFDERNRKSLPYLYFKPADRTASQLKNGSMKLIELEEVSNKILSYWTIGEATMDSQDRYNVYRLKAREVYYSIFSIADVYIMANNLDPVPIYKIPTVKGQLFRLSEYANYMATCGTVLKGSKSRLLKQRDAAVSLIENISKAYSL